MVNGTSVEAVPFPNEDHQAMLADYKYSASRMGNAPSITATLNYPTCLDAEWTDSVYVEFRGEKYYIKGVPSSSHDNNSHSYKHNLEFTSERVVLDSVYFFDVVQENNENDNPVANSADFSFHGTVKEFAERLNRSMAWSGIGRYKVIVDGDVEFKDAMYTASNQYISDALKSMYDVYEVPYYFVGREIHIGYAERIIEEPLKYGAKNSLISVGKNYTNDKIVNKITGTGSDKNITYYYPNPTPKGYVSVESNTSGAEIAVKNQVVFANIVPIGSNVTYVVGKDFTPVKYAVLYNNGEIGEETSYDDAGVYFGPGRHGNRFFIPFIQKESGSISLSVSYNITRGSSSSVGSTSRVKSAKIISLTESISYHPVITNNWNVLYDAEIPSGAYHLVLDVWIYTATLSVDSTITAHDNKYNYWKIDGNNREYSPSELGVTIIGEPAPGDSFSLKVDKRVNVQNNLMPSIYRKTDGEQRFYIAENDKYKDEEGNDIVFKRPYSNDRPKEYILNNDEIFPTIEGMTNASGLRIDMFSEFAYDKDDNDEIYPEDYENSNLAGKYKHPYFFGKLRKFNGEHGFNLFDHAIEGGEMTFSFKTGKVGGCNFKIGVDEDEGKYNLVQVYEVDTYEIGYGWHYKGELKRDENGNVLSGYAPNGGSQTPQACQQDTVNNEVWIALKKDIDTFGVLMPNAENSYRPSTEDTFVIINIDLPEAYVTAAEKRLEDEIIKHMSENNDYKFTFSAKLSRIFFAENEQFATELNENSKVSVEYDGVIYPMHVSSYSYTAKESEILPEVSIGLNDEIKIFKGALERVKNEFKFVLGPTVDKIDIKLKETSNSLSNTTRIAKVANETAAAAKTSSDELKVEIKDVGAVASGAKLSAENAQLSATQAKEGITAVGNEVGTLKTTVTSTQNIASSAQLIANNAMSEIGRVSSETTAKFNSVDGSINGIERDVNALEGLIGDEYNIWFENEDQQGSEPTLENYPASDWTSDDDYFNHDKDLYYSITLGRAWRFMYNEGEPFWEEITDADTITALTKAKEALDKANEAIEAVHDLDYLKSVFGDTEVMNEHAVILSRLLAVSDDYDNVVAGVYGGGVSVLDDNGYKDNSHGQLMMFAGAIDAQHASTANFRVYSDGCIFANSGTFGGIMKRANKVITRKNLNDFTYLDANGTRVLDLTKTGSFITFGLLSTPNLSIRLPWYSSDPNAGSIDDSDDLLSIIGTKVIVKFTVSSNDFCFNTALFDNGTVAPQCLPIREASTFVFECKAGKDTFGAVNIGWEMTEL